MHPILSVHNSRDLRIPVESHQTVVREVEFTNPAGGAVRFSVERENESDRVLGHRKG